jgi:RimJ/RimL family protein N-acetyltransferase
VASLGGELSVAVAGGCVARVRDARARDARPLKRLLDAIAAEPQVTLLMLPGQFSATVWRRRIADALADPRALLLVATVDGELAGNLGLHPDAHGSSAHVAWLGMSVGREWRGRGLGGALLEAGVSWAADRGIIKVALGVLPGNLRALDFYRNHGFTREGLRTAQYERAGRYYDEVLMARFIGCGWLPLGHLPAPSGGASGRASGAGGA